MKQKPVQESKRKQQVYFEDDMGNSEVLNSEAHEESFAELQGLDPAASTY